MSRFLLSSPRVLALLACAGLVSTPALAAPMARTAPTVSPVSAKAAQPSWSPADESADNHRRWRRHRGGNGIDGGDLLGGLLVLGGIAAVASAIDKSNDEVRDRRGYDDRAYDERAYDQRDDRGRWDEQVERSGWSDGAWNEDDRWSARDGYDGRTVGYHEDDGGSYDPAPAYDYRDLRSR
jgi:hypothetical protein